jgi:16S rRNA (cytidine1402-2'-O)-methyltransferase
LALWIVATPIGTLGDLSPRAQKVLGDADLIVAEDTRVTRRLLTAFAIPAPKIEALHAHNEVSRSADVAELAMEQQVVLVSDAGTPGVSDPGSHLVRVALERGVELRTVPGPSALAAALAVSGFPAAPSLFVGFAPRKGRTNWAAQQLRHPHTVVIYEAPGRVSDLTQKFAALAPQREAVMCRELSKRFEEVVRLPLAALAQDLSSRDRIRGECVLLLGPGEPLAVEKPVTTGEGTKEVAASLAARWGMKKRDVYQGLLRLQRELEEG